jgi:hypothetical protein
MSENNAMHGKFLLTASTFLLTALGASAASAAPSTLDATLFATYRTSPTSVSFVICGSLPDSEGCYGFGTMSPFQNACAVLEGRPKTTGDVVTRAIYVLDKRSSKKEPVTLYVYERLDTISSSYDSVQVKLIQQVPLGITGGPAAKCWMAGNDDFVYAGTSVGGAVSVNKKSLAITPEGSGPLVNITSDERGYVSLNFSGEFGLVGPQGQGEESGGGNAEMVNTRNAVSF